MSTDIFDRHAQDWEDYFQQYDKTRNQLEADELTIRKHFGMNDKDLPVEMREMIDRNRKAWVNEWGAKGTRKQEISDRHMAEIRQGYQNGFPEIVPVQMPEPESNPEPAISPYTQEELEQQFADQRTEAQERLKGELNAIEYAYKEKGEPVPQATQKRMARRVIAFNQQWYGIEPETPLKDVKVMNEADHQNHFKSFRDLAKSHDIIKAHYGHPDKVPEATNRELAHEMDEFHNEVDAYNAERKQQRGEFKTRLDTIRNQQHSNTLKPR